VLRYAAFDADASPGAVLSYLALVVVSGAWVTARSALSLCFKIGQRA